MRYPRLQLIHTRRLAFAAMLALTCDIPLATSASPSDDAALARRDAIAVRAIERMQGFDYRKHPEVKAAIERQIQRTQGTPEFIKLVKRFQPEGIEQQLIETVYSENKSAAVEAAELLLDMEEGRTLIRNKLVSKDQAIATAEVLGLLGNGRSVWLLSELSKNAEADFDLRRAAVAALARSKGGQRKLIEQAKDKSLVGDTLLIAGAMLARSDDAEIRNSAAEVLPQPAQKDSQPLPPVDRLAKQKGDVERGKSLFRSTATCANCHIVDGFGKDVGPNLSEIGNKLSREAMLTAILLPSAGISHNYENFVVLTADGQVISGLKVSETDDEVVIRTADAIDRKIASDDIETMKKSEKSIMPENLHHVFGQQGLVDLVEYMSTLKKAQ
ncbi:c-type cytochrome [Stieleria sp. JC731]|uniref:c-type cytochrome n=1 Tax=Pirellulaceae TaxID=2691357 RepID=UPI001E5F7323|nr:c-type cytochrome [Stieleria sp. JC731]MCC9603247.1 c-type cytochrome [Stieleria sp. JC731]